MSANPFTSGIPGSKTQYIDADSRLRCVKEFTSIAECEAALTVPGIQLTVQKAVERKLRKFKAETAKGAA